MASAFGALRPHNAQTHGRASTTREAKGSGRSSTSSARTAPRHSGHRTTGASAWRRRSARAHARHMSATQDEAVAAAASAWGTMTGSRAMDMEAADETNKK